MDDRRLYNIWSCMRQRCNNPNHTAARWYHDRGIRVCDAWNNDFQAFQTWALNNGYREDLTIDRIDPDGWYTPDNCRWVSRSENSKGARRRKTTVLVQEDEIASDQKPRLVVRKPKGKFMVVKFPPYATIYAPGMVVQTGLTKPQARKWIEAQNDYPWEKQRYSIYITDNHTEGDWVYRSHLRYFLSGKRANDPNLKQEVTT